MITISGIGEIAADIQARKSQGASSNDLSLYIPPKEKSLWQHWFETTTGVHVLDFDTEVKFLGVQLRTNPDVTPGTVRVQGKDDFKNLEIEVKLGVGLCQEDTERTWFDGLSDRSSHVLQAASV